MSCGLHHFSQPHDLCGLHVTSSTEEASPVAAANPEMTVARQEVPNGVHVFLKSRDYI